MKTKLDHKQIQREILSVMARDSDGKFSPVDLSLGAVNQWRASVGLPPIVKVPS